MHIALPETARPLRTETLSCDFAVIGGGLAGVCAAISAARRGLRVVLVQDRPVLGGNASSEVRLWTLGATAHMGAPQRWAREGGLIDEILLENFHRNREGNALFFDAVLLDKVVSEPNITLLLNTAALEVEKSDADTISAVNAFCSQNSTRYEIRAPLFCDASGDGIVGFLAGAAFRMGAESREEFGEKFAPNREYGELLGHSIYFYTKDTGREVRYLPPSFALQNVPEKIPRFRRFNTRDHGCQLWWIEYGGRLDTVHDTEKIKWELWRVCYGVWDYIKNSGEFPDAKNLTLEWIGHIPGKRESRRFEGDVWVKQQDVIEQKQWHDAVAFGGWALDLHPADGVYSEKSGCTHWRMRGLYGIPYRALYSKNLKNLFLGGRTMSVTHAAYGSTRVMATLAHCAQAIGAAAFLCQEHGISPREVGEYIEDLQRDLWRNGQHIPEISFRDADDLAQTATISASSELVLSRLESNEKTTPLCDARGMILPLEKGRAPRVTLLADAEKDTEIELSLRVSGKAHNHDFNEILDRKIVPIKAGKKVPVVFDFEAPIESARYGLFVVWSNPDVALHQTDTRLSGVLGVRFAYRQDPFRGGDARGKSVETSDESDIGVEVFDVYLPQRRPEGHNFALEIEPPLRAFAPENLRNGVQRPTNASNAFLADFADKSPQIRFSWPQKQRISRVELFFDTDFDHPVESVLMGHPESKMPFCAKHFRLKHGETVLFERDGNFQSHVSAQFPSVETDELVLEIVESWGDVPRGLFEVRIYA